MLHAESCMSPNIFLTCSWCVFTHFVLLPVALPGNPFQKHFVLSLSSLPARGTHFQKPVFFSLSSLPAGGTHYQKLIFDVQTFVRAVVIAAGALFSGKKAVPDLLNVSKLRNQRCSYLFKFACFGVYLQRFEALETDRSWIFEADMYCRCVYMHCICV